MQSSSPSQSGLGGAGCGGLRGPARPFPEQQDVTVNANAPQGANPIGAIAPQIQMTVTPAKAGVQKPESEHNRNEATNYGRWIPAFAGMTIKTRGMMVDNSSECDCSDNPMEGKETKWLHK